MFYIISDFEFQIENLFISTRKIKLSFDLKEKQDNKDFYEELSKNYSLHNFITFLCI